ncbi:S8 family serine peptidase [Rothia nasisuis]|uniref:S8 family serine peptidase n=1 Tax=Rothia nasisuis TaxID=2109647 RepID=UPI001F021D2E|nr:S8 family serine peptidase [Rothia nasisuis]
MPISTPPLSFAALKHTAGKNLVVASVLALALGASTAPATVAEEPAQDITQQVEPAHSDELVKKDTDRIIVTFAQETSAEDRQAIVDRALTDTTAVEAAEVVKDSVGEDPATGVIQTDQTLTEAEQAETIEALTAAPEVVAAEPDQLVRAVQNVYGAATKEPLYGTLWNFRNANVAEAWYRADGSGTTIAVVDTGITYHPDLASKLVAGYDFISDNSYARDGGGRDSDPTDVGTFSGSTSSNWHGTHVAGIAAAAAQGSGLPGVAPGARVQPVRVLGINGWGYASDIADGIAWASGGTVPGAPRNATPATVVNASLAWPSSTCPAALDAAIRGAHSRGVPVVVASGNAGANANYWTPSNCYYAIVVGATGGDNSLTGYSNWGSTLDVLAPGGTAWQQVRSTSNAGRTTATTASFGDLYGTSQAAPMVSGTIALMKQVNPGLTVEQIRNTLVSTGTAASGYRLVNTGKAVAAVAPATPTYRLTGGIGAYYYSNGGQGIFGRPTQNEYASGGGVIQNFSNSYTLYWTANYGTQPMRWGTGIGTFYANQRWELGYLGYPSTAEYAYYGGAAQNFWNPRTGVRYAVLWSPATGTHSVVARGAIANKWYGMGGPTGVGFPASSEIAVTDGGVAQYFRRSSSETVYHWHPRYGTTAVNARGSFFNYWKNNGYTARLGYPLHDERWEGDGRVHLRFSSGAHLTWSGSEGLRRVG